MERDVSQEKLPPFSPSPDAASNPRQQLVQQIATGNLDRSTLFSQLSSNPFFTAVRIFMDYNLPAANTDPYPRDLVSQLSASSHALAKKA